jgi:hypothetical protein
MEQFPMMNPDPKIAWTNQQRVSRSATIQVNASLATTFPLFGPVLEKLWAWGWNPHVIYSSVPLIEEKMIFRTRGDEGDYTWAVARYEPEQHLVEYIVHAETRVWFITVSCREAEKGTSATVTYTYTGLTKEGSARNQEAIDEMFRHDLKDWEEAISYYLSTGEVLRPELASFI